jgi:hypothetical protein
MAMKRKADRFMFVAWFYFLYNEMLDRMGMRKTRRFDEVEIEARMCTCVYANNILGRK